VRAYEGASVRTQMALRADESAAALVAFIGAKRRHWAKGLIHHES
jgi:hypothetical protein